jgi:ankyrin repeat protein
MIYATRPADINKTDLSRGRTFLHGAILARLKPGILRLAIEKGANVGAIDNNNETPLHAAAIVGDQEAIKILIEKKAEIDAKNKYQRTSLHLAAKEGHVEIVTLLLANGASPDLTDNEGETPLTKALGASKNREAVVNLFLS